METYEWQKNKAIVDRLYYSERIIEGSTIAAMFSTGVHGLYMKQNYFAQSARRRLVKTWFLWGAFNCVTLFVLLVPLKKEEIAIQW